MPCHRIGCCSLWKIKEQETNLLTRYKGRNKRHYPWGRKRDALREMRNGMNQKERMLAGLPYKAWLDGLSGERRMEIRKGYTAITASPRNRGKNRQHLSREIIGKCGENIWIETPFHYDYGWNIEVGEILLPITL